MARPAESAERPSAPRIPEVAPPTAAEGAALGDRRPDRRPRLLPGERRIILVGIDVLVALAAALIAAGAGSVFDPSSSGGDSAVLWNLVLGALVLFVGSLGGIHDLDIALRPRSALPALISAAAGGLLGLMLIFFILGRPIFALRDEGLDLTAGSLRPPPRLAPLLFLVLVLVMLGAWRWAAAKLLSSRLLRHRAIVVGAGASARRLLADLARMPHHYEIVGLMDDDPGKRGLRLGALRVVCDRRGLVEAARRSDVREVILATTQPLHPDLLRELIRCYELGMVIRPMPAVYEELAGRVPVEHLGQKWFLAPFWNEIGLPGIDAAVKRAIDLAAASVGLLVTVVLLPLIAVAIKLDTRGPVFYRQERLGRGGRPFSVVKFRSMRLGAEPSGRAVWAIADDPRVTRIGHLLRRTRLDELPQFWNVLRGEMSVVGPRPERASFIARLEKEIPFYRIRLAVKPGLTGWAQIRYPYANTFEDALRKLEFDLYYVKRQSLLLDLTILARTIGVVATFRGH